VSERKPVMTVIAGPNGSGKTTLTKEVLAHVTTQDVQYINADEIAEKQFGGWNSTEAIIKAANHADDLRSQCIEQKKSFVYETVFSTPRRVEDLQRAKDNGFFVQLVFVSTENPEINVDRVQRRVENGGHTVPTDKIIARYHRSMDNLAPALAIADRGYVFDNTAENSDHRIIFRTVDGEIKKAYEKPLPEWAQQAAKRLETQAQALDVKAARDSILDAVSSHGSVLDNALKEKKMEQDREREQSRNERSAKRKGPSHEL